MKKYSILLISALLTASCTTKPSFVHNLPPGPTPWTSEPQATTESQFSFAIIGDLNGEERNGIFSVAAEQLGLIKPKFIMSIGDLIEGGSEDTIQLRKEFNFLDQRAAKTGVPFFHVGGNHDLTNMVMRRYWQKRYGQTYYHFKYNNTLFLVLDSEDYDSARFNQIFLARKRAIELLDSGKTEEARASEYFNMTERISGQIGPAQSAYFEKAINDNPNVRWTFLFMHKPVWKRETEGNLSRIESALGPRNYTLFNGHLHDYSHTYRNDRDYIMLGTTGGGQVANSPTSFDHITWVTMTDTGPLIANLRMDGILDKTGKIPMGGDSLCFQASKCAEEAKE